MDTLLWIILSVLSLWVIVGTYKFHKTAALIEAKAAKDAASKHAQDIIRYIGGLRLCLEDCREFILDGDNCSEPSAIKLVERIEELVPATTMERKENATLY